MGIEEDNELVDNFRSNEEELDFEEDDENSSNSEIIDHSHNPSIYNFKYVYSYFQKYGIMISSIVCPNCNSQMNIVKETSFFDKICYRCKKSNPNHYIKINIRKNSILEEINIELINIFFII